MPAIQNRICIYTKDIQRITGKSERYARMLIEKVRQANQKKKGDLITVDEFCQYTRLKKEQVEKFLLD